MIALAAAALLLAAPAPDAPAARGRYLANGILRCFWCHSPLDGGDPVAVPIPEKLGSGDVLDPGLPLHAPNLTPDRDTGLGGWTDAEIVRAMREGIGRDGQRLRADHPDAYYSVMTDGDAAAVVAYLRTLRPIRRRLARSPRQARRRETVQPAVAPALETSHTTPHARGAYLVHLGECKGCHTPARKDGTPLRFLSFAGGRPFSVEKGVGSEDDSAKPGPRFFSANLTPDPSGIPYYTPEVFIQTIRTGRVAGVRPLSAAMPWVFFRNLTDDDLRAIFAYLQAVPPVRHRIDNVHPPTPCPLCGRRHGLGELNVQR